MTALRRMAVATTAVIGILATAGCSTTVTGVPLAATAPRSIAVPTTPDGSPESGAAAPSDAGPSDAGPSAGTGTTDASGPASDSAASTTTSPIRPMPPLDATRSGTAGGPDADTTSQSEAAGDPGTGPDVDLADISAQLADGSVARVASSADLDALRLLAAQADAAGMPTSIVVIGSPIPDASTSTLTDRLWADLGDTVVVLSPSLISARSDLLSEQQRDDAVRAAADAADDENAVLTFLNTGLGELGLANPLTMPPPTSEVVAGIDIAAAVAAIGPNHIAISPGATHADEEKVRPAVDEAWARGVSLYVVVLSRDATGPLTDVSRAIMQYTGGTVLVIGSSRFALSSDTFTDDELATVLDDAGAAESYDALVAAVVDKLTG